MTTILASSLVVKEVARADFNELSWFLISLIHVAAVNQYQQ